MRKISDTSDIKQGDILRDPVTNALFEVLKVDFGMALLEIKTKSSQICASPHEEFEEWFTNPGDKFGFTWIMNMLVNGSKQILKFAYGRCI